MNPTTAPVPYQWLSTIILGLGGLTFILTFVRALLIIDQEFSDDDQMIKDPLSTTLNPATDYEGFRSKSWHGFEALWAAVRFRGFYRRFRPVLEQGHAVTLLMSMLFALIAVVFVSTVEKLGPLVQGGIGVSVGFLSACYLVLIERGKSLKKAAIRLKV